MYIGQSNLACIYFKMGRYPAACLFFQDALKLLPPPSSELPLKQTYAIDVAYNYALSLLHAGVHQEALGMFRAVSGSFLQARPLLWLRMGECCIGAYKSLLASATATPASAISIGKSKKLALSTFKSTGEDSGVAFLRDAVAHLSHALFLATSRRSKTHFTELRYDKPESLDGADAQQQVRTHSQPCDQCVIHLLRPRVMRT